MTLRMHQASDSRFLANAVDDWEFERSKAAVKDLTELIDPERYVGDLISLEYGFANILIHDYHKRRVGGIPHGCLLLATRMTPEEPEITEPDSERMSLILLRVTEGAPLVSDTEVARMRLEAVRRANDTAQNYDESGRTDQFTLDMLRYAGAKCRILGTFRMYRDNSGDKWRKHFGGDIDNFYAGQGMKIYKPHGGALKKIVNFRGANEGDAEPTTIGHVRYAASVDPNTPESVSVEITADDMIAQRTALFGMTRSGKSNTTKIIAAAIYTLRANGGQRVGQLIFDPNGEYANDNPQDQGCLRNVRLTDDDVHTYGSYKHPHDPCRRITKFDFFGKQEPGAGKADSQTLKAALETLYQGKQIINDALRVENAGYISRFVSADIEGGADPSDYGDYTRLKRRLFFYRAVLVEAGFPPPKYAPQVKPLFGKDLQDRMNKENSLKQYIPYLEHNKRMSWEIAGNFSRAFAEWVKTQTFKNYDSEYAQKRDGSNWSDTHLLGLLGIYDNTRGIGMIQKTRDWHDPESTSDYAEDIVRKVREGNLVIVDQLLGDPDMNRQAAERIVSRIFDSQQRSFITPEIDPATGEIKKPPPVIIYAEEAHTLLPEEKESDSSNIWARIAKEGAKFNIGMVYSTQEPSSIQRNILTNTENWFVAHLSSRDEIAQLRKYKDFEDFTESILSVSEPGFLRVRTRSTHYTVPVQMKLFTAPSRKAPPSINGTRAQPQMI